MFCANCGAENAPGAGLCLSCGATLAARCLRCAAELPVVARFCPACGQPVQLPPETRAEVSDTTRTERRQVTVLFADLAGFTAFVQKVDVEDVRELMNSLWARLDHIIAEHGGTTEKHIGDAVMAIFGARQARENDPVQAVRAALAIQAALAELRLARAPQLQMRVGVHTGLVVVGPLGSSGEFTATGDAVNLASRLEQHAPVGGALISHDTYRHVFGFFDVQTVPPFTVKGRPEPVQGYLVIRAKPRALAAQLRGVAGVTTEMIGRQTELKLLESALQRVISERALQLVTIIGDAGIGKSCLLREFQHWVELLPENVRWFGGRATAETAGVPFSLMRDVFSARFEILESDSPAVAREKLERGFLELLSSSAEDEVPELHHQAHFTGQLLGLNFSDRPGLRGILKDADEFRRRAFNCLSRFFDTISQCPATADAPAVKAALLVAEDLHWADEGSLEFIEHLAQSCRTAPLMIVCLARPTLLERRPAWGRALPSQTRVVLDPLSRPESLHLVEAILRKAPEIPQALRELIVGGAEGIPFFIEEIVNMLIDQKVIVPGLQDWRIEPVGLAAANVPPTLTGVLQARLDRLAPVERTVLRRASVVGRIFWDSAVEALSTPKRQSRNGTAVTQMRQELNETLEALCRKELLSRREGTAFAGTIEYAFKHELLRNVAYEGLLKKSRRSLHGRVAAWLIDHSGERINEFAALLAGHFEQADQRNAAAAWFGRAGQQARHGYAHSTAIECFRKAFALLSTDGSGPPPAEQLQWHEGLGEVLGAQARFAEGLEAYGAARGLAEQLGDVLTQARAWNGLAFLQERLGKNRPSIECAEHADALARQAGEPGHSELVRALHLKGWACYRLGDAPAVLALGDQTLKLCTEFGDRRGLATSFKLHGVAHLQLGHFLEADRYFEQGLALSQELDDRRNTAAMFSNRGECARMRGEFEAAARLYQQALDLARQIEHRESEVIYLSNLSAARLGLREFKPVEADLRQAISLTDDPNSCALAETYTLLSEACLGQGKVAEALDIARRALVLARESENELYLGGAWRILGQVTAVLPPEQRIASSGVRTMQLEGDRDPAACFAESLAVFRKINAEGEQARTLRAWAEFDLREGRTEMGRARAHEARTIFLRLAATPEVFRTDALLA